MENYIGKMLDNRYEILEVIGTGGMAVVFKARCHLLNRLVAIKVLKSELADDAEFRRRFHDESQAVAKLSHPNIVSVYDVSRGGEMEYIVMELIDGITLKQYMERRGQLNWRESLHFITQIMKGLGHAHSRDIIHRDIKPHNIMVLRDGSVKVADFGIACLSAGDQNGGEQETLGSVHYISPEQAKGDRTDARSDIYSAGVVLYEMLTNRLPFEGETPVSVAIQHFSAVPLGPREINPEIPEALEKICLKAMAPGLDKRYGSADEMIRDLEEFRKNPEINFDYDVSELRQQENDEPTQYVSIKEQRERRRLRDEDDEEEQPPMAGWKKALLTLVLLAVGGWLAFNLYNIILTSLTPDPVKEYTVPSVVGYTLEDAAKLPGVEGIFEIVESGKRPSEEYGPGVILDQDPKAETTKRSDLVISVVISQGGKTQEMPPLVGTDWRVAEQMLKNYKMDITVEVKEEKYSDTVDAGLILSTDPAPGATLGKGDVVSVVISKGPEKVTVISFLGLSQSVAERNAQAMGLVPVIEEQEDETTPAGFISGQDISPTTRVDPGSRITLYVSIGPGEEPPPEENPGTEEPPVDPGPTEPTEPVELPTGGGEPNA